MEGVLGLSGGETIGLVAGISPFVVGLIWASIHRREIQNHPRKVTHRRISLKKR